MLARGRAAMPRPLISATAPLAEGAAWFDRLYRKEPGLLKVVLKALKQACTCVVETNIP